MTSIFSRISLQLNFRRSVPLLVAIAAAALSTGTSASAQAVTPASKPSASANDTPPTPDDNIRYGYAIHQSIDFGGRILAENGSSAMYDTLVNLQAGPRVLDQSLEMRAVNPAHAFLFDRLSTTSFGYGGDPNNVTYLNISKGRIYDFHSSFRRDRQYFDYDLLANPLIPPTSTPFIPILNTPHLYNTVRRMTDVQLTVAPLSKVNAHFGYFQNVNQGPTTSTIHVGGDALLTQYWRNSTDVWNAGVTWKPLRNTSLNFDEFITHFKGNTHWELTGLNYQLSNGAPVSLGIDVSSVWKAPCAAPFNPDGTVNPTCSGFLSYTRFGPTRTLFPSEQFRFQSTSIPNVSMNGRFLYMDTTSRLPNFYENFNGLDARAQTRLTNVTASANASRININADYGITWQVTPKVSLNDVFDYWDFRENTASIYTETDYAGTSMLQPPGAATTTVTIQPPAAVGYSPINQNTKVNTFYANWDVNPVTRLSLGYRFSTRTVSDIGGDYIPIRSNWSLFGIVFRPNPQFRANFNFDWMYANNSFTRVDPRQMQHYVLRTAYNPKHWLSFNGTLNILEDRDNVQTVDHLAHNRNYSFSTAIAPSEKWSVNLSYSYNDIFSRTDECYASSAPVDGGIPSPPVCQDASLPWVASGYYNQPTQYGAFEFDYTPVNKVHAIAGYRISSTVGQAPPINIRQVPGSLQSQYQTPYGTIAYDLAPNWTWKADYNYYGYGEGSPIGPTLPRAFHANIVTIGVRYAF